MITQGVLQADKWTSEHLRGRQKQLLEKLCEVWHLESVDVEDELIDIGPQKGTWQFTDSAIIEAKRQKIMDSFSHREGVKLNKKGALYWNDDKTLRAVCAVSKRHSRRARPYWYGYSPKRRNFLLEGRKAFLLLGCVDRDSAYAVPSIELEKVLNDLHETPGTHWHIELGVSESGGLDLVPRSGPRIPLTKFELKLSG